METRPMTEFEERAMQRMLDAQKERDALKDEVHAAHEHRREVERQTDATIIKLEAERDARQAQVQSLGRTIDELQEQLRSFCSGYSTIAEALGTEVADTNDWDLRNKVKAVVAERDALQAAYELRVAEAEYNISRANDAVAERDALTGQLLKAFAGRDASRGEAERLRELLALAVSNCDEVDSIRAALRVAESAAAGEDWSKGPAENMRRLTEEGRHGK